MSIRIVKSPGETLSIGNVLSTTQVAFLNEWHTISFSPALCFAVRDGKAGGSFALCMVINRRIGGADALCGHQRNTVGALGNGPRELGDQFGFYVDVYAHVVGFGDRGMEPTANVTTR